MGEKCASSNLITGDHFPFPVLHYSDTCTIYPQRKAKLQEEKEESEGSMERKEQKGWRTLLKALL